MSYSVSVSIEGSLTDSMRRAGLHGSWRCAHASPGDRACRRHRRSCTNAQDGQAVLRVSGAAGARPASDRVFYPKTAAIDESLQLRDN
jgi:hypothetical protein